jgi:hypothetical protein
MHQEVQKRVFRLDVCTQHHTKLKKYRVHQYTCSHAERAPHLGWQAERRSRPTSTLQTYFFEQRTHFVLFRRNSCMDLCQPRCRVSLRTIEYLHELAGLQQRTTDVRDAANTKNAVLEDHRNIQAFKRRLQIQFPSTAGMLERGCCATQNCACTGARQLFVAAARIKSTIIARTCIGTPSRPNSTGAVSGKTCSPRTNSLSPLSYSTVY